MTFHREQFTQELSELVRIPSISQRVEHKEDCYAVAEKMQHFLKKLGAETRIVATKGNPVLLGELASASRERIVIYNHLDVQPAEEPQWKTSPFEPVVKDGIMFGRGTTDDKGPALTILHAIREMQSQNIPMPSIQFVYETEEEIGSPNFGGFLDETLGNGSLKPPHSVLVSDSEFEGEYPTLNYKLRGMARLFLTLETASQEAHSGVVGGVAKNPLEILSRVLVSMKDEMGNITIPHYLDDVAPLTPIEKEMTQKVAAHMDVEKFKRETGVNELFTENSEEMLTRIWHRPTMEMHGFEGAQHLPKVMKSSIPNKVTAKISLRLVPNQTPEKAIERIRAYVQTLHPGIVVEGDGQPPSVMEINNPYMQLGKEACREGYGKDALFVGAGGSIGAVAKFQRVWKGTPMVLISQSLLSDGYHAPNENFRLAQAEKGMATMQRYLEKVGKKS
ncbi:MAG: M20/M25/M40 family metallo-hydrolase [archaeon]